MFSFKNLALFTLASVALANANPVDLTARQTGACTPVFNGAQTIYQPLDITDVVNEWFPDPNPATVGGHVRLIKESAKVAFEKGEFLVEQSGQPNPTFQFKYDHSLLFSFGRCKADIGHEQARR